MSWHKCRARSRPANRWSGLVDIEYESFSQGVTREERIAVAVGVVCVRSDMRSMWDKVVREGGRWLVGIAEGWQFSCA